MTALCDLSLTALSRALARGEHESSAATEACLARAADTKGLGAYLLIDAEGARRQAAAADLRCRAGQRLGPLDGVPLALKDIFLTAGLKTTCGSRILEDFVAPYDATVVRRLKDAGAVVLGKLSMDEFAMGSSNEHCAFGPAKNPWDPTRVPGGSSGGSAVAVASGSAFAALGTDTGGSIRQPAALCGVVGLKPTYGRVSRYGVIAFASSLDQVGPITKDVSDCALLLETIAGHDPKDSTSAPVLAASATEGLEAGVKGLKLGVPKEYFVAGIDPEVRTAVERAIATYAGLGADIVEVSLPHTEYAIATYYLIATAEASSNLARYDGVRFGLRRDPGRGVRDMYLQTRARGFGPEVKRRIVLGTYVLSAGYYEAYYDRAQKVRTLIRRDFAAAFAKADLLVTPTSPTPAFRLGARLADPLQMYLADIFTVGCNLAGIPGLSLPCGFANDGMPIGLQLLGPAWSEATLTRAGRAYEREHDWSRRRPPLARP
ncbi:MAG: Asp-tRNA(Asn)/Glu-tRNA(Gln) amidotransferase subunit GatA [Deltaproteobacteria bacterium]|nr:Asp-tRNA(Asn)/Glu-tRNA(Gln) amidotransferase subunit GatA [Deltaproteobacteria bacterium]